MNILNAPSSSFHLTRLLQSCSRSYSPPLISHSYVLFCTPCGILSFLSNKSRGPLLEEGYSTTHPDEMALQKFFRQSSMAWNWSWDSCSRELNYVIIIYVRHGSSAPWLYSTNTGVLTWFSVAPRNVRVFSERSRQNFHKSIHTVHSATGKPEEQGTPSRE